jgi:S-formylglutathione hydrolase FrmB
VKYFLVCLFIWLSNANAQTAEHIQSFSFHAPSVGITLRFKAVLPANYFADSSKRFSVVYLLHGHTGNYNSWLSYAQLPTQLASRHQCIIILPDAGNSWYVNWTGQTDGKAHRWEDMVMNDLIPTVDLQLRTIPTKQHRIIGGLSMGGFGALSMGLRHPHHFGAIICSAGAIGFCEKIIAEINKDTVDWNAPEGWSNDDKKVDVPGFSNAEERTPKGHVFANKADAQAYDPFQLLHQLDANVLPFIHIDAGTNDDFLEDAKRFIQALQQKKAVYSALILPGKHDTPYWQQSIEISFEILSQQHLLRKP